MSKIVKIVSINLLGVATVVALAEVVFGAWFWGDPLGNLNIFRNVQWTYSVADTYPGKSTVTYNRDKWGFRGRGLDPSTIDVLVVGGSTTDERYIDEEQTWVGQLQSCLQREGGNLVFANGGVTGQSSRGHGTNFDLWYTRIPGLKPKYVLAYVGINELWAAGRQALSKDDVRRFNEELQPWARWAEIVQHLKLKSAVYRLYRTLKGMWIARNANLAYSDDHDGSIRADIAFDRKFEHLKSRSLVIGSGTYMDLLAEQQRLRSNVISLYEFNIAQLTAKVRSIGAEPVYATQTWGTYRKSGNRIVGDVKQFLAQKTINDVTRRHCKKEGLHCIDIGAEMNFADGDLYDVVHTTPSGSKRIADFMCRNWPVG